MRDHYDIAVLGFWYGANYGSLLNGYAMYRTLKGMGQSVLMVHKPGIPKGDPELTGGHNVDFVRKYYDPEEVSGHYPYERLGELNDLCDCFCAGSDQIWNYPISFGENMYLPFAREGKKLISFAASFGNPTGNIPPEAKARLKGYFRRFTAISVRERFAERLLLREFDVKATTILEPVFLLDREIYEGMAESSRFQPNEEYLLTYILDPTPEKRRAILRYAEALHLPVVNLLDGKHYLEGNDRRNLEMHDFALTVRDAGCEEFLRAFSRASFVITDSFHGTAFSILFRRRFLAIGNPLRGSERFTDLLERLCLIDRLALDPQRIPFDRRYFSLIDYAETEEAIAREKEHSLHWLRETVTIPVR